MINENGTDRDFRIKVEAPVGIGEVELMALRINAPPSARLAVLIELDSQYRAKFEEDGIDLAENDYTFLALSFSPEICGCSVTYKHPSDVPLVDVLCEHGNYLLRWTDDI